MSYDLDDFDVVPDLGGFVVVRDHKDHLVAFPAVHKIGERPSNFNEGQMEPIATVDFVDLDGDQQLRERVQITSQYVVEKLTVGRPAFGVIRQLPAKKKGQQGAYIIEAPDDVAGAKQRIGRWLAAQQAKSFAAPSASQPDADTDALSSALSGS